MSGDVLIADEMSYVDALCEMSSSLLEIRRSPNLCWRVCWIFVLIVLVAITCSTTWPVTKAYWFYGTQSKVSEGWVDTLEFPRITLCTPNWLKENQLTEDTKGKVNRFGKTGSVTSQNPCSINPCQNGGTCKQDTFYGMDRYVCECPEAWVGGDCEEVSPCANIVCKNGGTCNNFYYPKCLCSDGWMGETCEKASPCANETNPCRNGATCVYEAFEAWHFEWSGVHSRTHYCQCSDGWVGKDCDNVSPCLSNPCQNGGNCREFKEDDYYVCLCPKGWTGEHCETNISEDVGEDSSEFCDSNPCQNGGQCRSYNKHYRCSCPTNFWGQHCEKASPCVNNPCQNGGNCKRYIDAYQCRCPDEGDWIGKHCEEVSPCAGNPCENSGKCIVIEPGRYKCYCPETWTGKNCEKASPCVSNPCRNEGKCSESMSSNYHYTDWTNYTCDCKSGWKGRRCDEATPCMSNPCQNEGECLVNDDGYWCKCAADWIGKHCEKGIPTMEYEPHNYLLMFAKQYSSHEIDDTKIDLSILQEREKEIFILNGNQSMNFTNVVENYSITCGETVRSCQVGLSPTRTIQNCCQHVHRFFYMSQMCFSFDLKEFQRTEGYNGGLQFSLTPQLGNRLSPTSPAGCPDTGVLSENCDWQVFLNDPASDENINFIQYDRIIARRYYLRLNALKDSNLEPPYGKCGAPQLKYFKTYSKQLCKREVQANISMEKCGCVPYHTLMHRMVEAERRGEVRLCLLSEIYGCFNKIVWKNLDVKRLCPQNCEFMSYETKPTEDLGYNKNKRRGAPATDSDIKVSIFFGEMTLRTAEDVIAMNIGDVAGIVGGTMSIYLGLGLMSFVQFFYFSILSLINLLLGKNQTPPEEEEEIKDKDENNMDKKKRNRKGKKKGFNKKK